MPRSSRSGAQRAIDHAVLTAGFDHLQGRQVIEGLEIEQGLLFVVDQQMALVIGLDRLGRVLDRQFEGQERFGRRSTATLASSLTLSCARNGETPAALATRTSCGRLLAGRSR